MQKIALCQIVNANIYINGVNLLGRAADIKLPDIAAVMTERKALGMVGKMKLPAGFEVMEGEITWNSLYEEVASVLANPFKTVQLQCRSSVERYDATGRVEEKELVTVITATFTKTTLGNFKHLENTDIPSSFTASYIKQTLGGKDIIELDVFSNIFKVSGEDQLTQFRENLGA